MLKFKKILNLTNLDKFRMSKHFNKFHNAKNFDKFHIQKIL